MKTVIISLAFIITGIISYAQCGTDSIQDYDGNWYHTVPIGNQCWLKENMRTTRYADGVSIPYVSDKDEWDALTASDKAYCYYDNSSSNGDTYGALYTWAAAMNGAVSSNANPSEVQGVCPDGWHLPSDDEWEELAEYISNDNGGYTKSQYIWENVGGHLKATSGWGSGGNGTDDYGFFALPGGARYLDGTFTNIGDYGYWWSATESNATNAWYRNVYYRDRIVGRSSLNKEIGFSVRCVRDSGLFDHLTISLDSIKDITFTGGSDGAIYISSIGGAESYSYLWNTGDTTRSISGLSKGTYFVTVTDSLYQTAIDSFTIFDPIKITKQPIQKVKCPGTKDTFFVEVNGRTPYHYQWKKDEATLIGDTLSSLTIPNITLSDEGVYHCEVTNPSGTVISDSAELIVIDLSVTATDKIRCVNDTAFLKADISTNHPVESGAIAFNWTPSDGLSDTTVSDPTAAPLATQTYTVMVSDEVGCQATDSVEVFFQNVFQNEEICMLTIDVATGKNMAVWEKTPNKGTVGYIVYKEGNQIGQYDSIGYVPFDSVTVWVDHTSLPEQQQDLYKISSIDICGNESPRSLYHKPLFLQFTNGQLEWQEYEIEDGSDIGFISYIIYRGADSTALTPIDTISASKKVYNDPSGIAQTNIFYYRVAGVKASTCYTDAKLKASGGPYSRSISNLEDNRLKMENIPAHDFAKEINLTIHPNPYEDFVNIKYTLNKSADIKIEALNALGNKLETIADEFQRSGSYKFTFGSGYPQGIYYVVFEYNGMRFVKKVVKMW